MSESKYPLIEKFLPELKIKTLVSSKENIDFIECIEIEKELDKGVVLYGDRMSDLDNIYTHRKEDRDISFGLLIGKQKLEEKKPVSAKEIVKTLRGQYGNIDHMLENFKKLCDRIEKNGLEK